MDEHALRSGDLIDDTYRIERHVGGGAMGQVYAARDERTGARIALKLLSMDYASQRDLDRFQREVELAARVDRKGGVVRVHAVGTTKGRPWCVMEFVEGEDLDSVLRRGPLDCARACELLETVARTLAACHTEGVIHRDLKPANIMISADGAPKVADFGLARDMTSDGLTRTGELVGTPAYMAPEQAIDAARAVDAAVDIYALGAVLFHAITGKPPFSGTSVLQILSDVANTEPPRPSRIRPEIPPDLEAVCLRAMAKAPADRYPSMTALADDLDRAARGSQVDARPIGAWERFSRRLAQREPVAVGAAVGGTALVVIAVLIAVWLSLAGSRQQRATEGLAQAETFQREVLDRWALGIGADSPPRADDLARRAALLERMVKHVPPGERARASELAEMLRAQGRLLEERLAPEERGPADAIVDAVLLARRGDTAAARKRIAPALRGRCRLTPTGWAAMWHAILPREANLASECLRSATRVAKLPPAGEEIVRQAASLRLRAVINESLRSDFDGLEVGCQAVRASLERVLAAQAPQAWAWVRADVLEVTAKQWVELFARTEPLGDTPAPPRALLRSARALGSLLHAEPVIELPPALAAGLRALFERAIASLTGELQTRQRVKGWWAVGLETVGFYYLDWHCPRLDVYEQFLRKEVRLSAHPAPRLDLAVAMARHGVALKGNEVIAESLVDIFATRARAVAFVPPESWCLRWIELEKALHRSSDNAFNSPHRKMLLTLAEQVFEPGIDDLSPLYRARARYLLCKLIRYEITRGEPSAALAERLVRESQILLVDANEGDEINEAFRSLATGVEQTGSKIDLREVAIHSVNALRKLALRPVKNQAQKHKRWQEQRRFAEFVLEYSKLMGHEAPHHVAAEGLLREALDLSARVRIPADVHLELLIELSDLLRDMNRPAEADAVLRPSMEEGLKAKSQFVKEAVRVSLELGDLEEARRRLELGEEYHRGRDVVQDARKRYEHALRKKREGR